MQEFVFGTLATVEKRVAHMREWRQGVKHHNRLTPRVPLADDRPIVKVTVQLDKPIERIDCVVSEPETAVYPFQCVTTQWDLLNWSYIETWQAQLPAQTEGTLVRYRIEAYPVGAGEPILADKGELFSYLVGEAKPPEWAADAIMYQIFPDRFYPGDGRNWNPTQSLNDIYGGTLRGIIQKLDYVAKIGFNAIWINPFFPDDNTHHGYHATDYFAVNPRLGTMDDIHELVDAAHQRGIRL
ncbi:MAG: hypothetical protein GY796_19220, partial [Chloroflexi bacterium]|nr:hypothetical protein [Chloroflexota bacterium]